MIQKDEDHRKIQELELALQVKNDAAIELFDENTKLRQVNAQLGAECQYRGKEVDKLREELLTTKALSNIWESRYNGAASRIEVFKNKSEYHTNTNFERKAAWP